MQVQPILAIFVTELQPSQAFQRSTLQAANGALTHVIQAQISRALQVPVSQLFALHNAEHTREPSNAEARGACTPTRRSAEPFVNETHVLHFASTPTQSPTTRHTHTWCQQRRDAPLRSSTPHGAAKNERHMCSTGSDHLICPPTPSICAGLVRSVPDDPAHGLSPPTPAVYYLKACRPTNSYCLLSEMLKTLAATTHTRPRECPARQRIRCALQTPSTCHSGTEALPEARRSPRLHGGAPCAWRAPKCGPRKNTCRDGPLRGGAATKN